MLLLFLISFFAVTTPIFFIQMAFCFLFFHSFIQLNNYQIQYNTIHIGLGEIHENDFDVDDDEMAPEEVNTSIYRVCKFVGCV